MKTETEKLDIKSATKYLQRYQQWRKGGTSEAYPEPKMITEAIDTVLAHLTKDTPKNRRLRALEGLKQMINTKEQG